jgi:hypothetical protein
MSRALGIRHMVSENSKADLARQRASDQVEWKLRELTANLLRITRGAGKPCEIMQQMVDLTEAMRRYQAATGLWPTDEFVRALNVSYDLETMQHWRDEDRHREYAKDHIIRGALQIVASRLVDQKTQEAAGRSEMHDGIRSLEDLRSEARKAITRAAKEFAAGAVKGRPAKPKAKVGRPRVR